MINEMLRSIPKMDVLLSKYTAIYEETLSQRHLKLIIETELSEIRQKILRGDIKKLNLEAVEAIIHDAIKTITIPSFKRVVNATGIILHTNLGRAVLSEQMLDAIKPALSHYNTLEYNVDTGRRGSRYDHVESKIRLLTGAEAALVVNNNAAAVMLVLSTLAKDKEVIVSRGELVEIGGAFRVPDVMLSSGCILKEIGTTNKTHLKDYEGAITEQTAMLMKVHTSNYKIMGFTKSIEASELVELGKSHNLPIFEDLGSGLMIPLNGADEPVVRDKIKEGIDILSFSGDKLFGGAQCGIIIGKKEYIEPMKKNPLLRAFRMDKMTLAVLEQSLIWYLNEKLVYDYIPTLKNIHQNSEQIKLKTESFLMQYQSALNELGLSPVLIETQSEVGGGSLPEVKKDSYGLAFNGLSSPSLYQELLRKQEVPIITMIQNETLVLNFATVFEDDFDLIFKGLSNVFEEVMI